MRPSFRGFVWFAWGVVAVLIAATAIVGIFGKPERMALRQAAPVPPASRPAGNGVTPPATAASPAARPAAREVKAPSFDVVTVDRAGQAVIAGRAGPGDRVRVLDGETPIGEVRADAHGEWVLVPATPIAPGNHQLAVEATGSATGPEGDAVRRSPDVVALSVVRPGAGQGERSDGTSTVAVLLPGEPGTPARVLQRPQGRPEVPGGAANLWLDTAEYGGSDKLVLSGGAEPGARLNVYAGGRLIGSATANDSGKWMLRSDYRGPAGGGELRLDQLAADGSVARRITAPLDPPGRPVIPDAETYVVERGNSLWRIARRHYGRGVRYTAIYEANQDMIRDPKLIYPGQELRLPQP
jgi:LysM domain